MREGWDTLDVYNKDQIENQRFYDISEKVVFDMKHSKTNLVSVILGGAGLLLLIGIIIGAYRVNKPTCIKPGCDNYRAEGSKYCYQHELSSYDSLDETSTSSTYSPQPTPTDSFGSESNYNSSGNSESSTKNYNNNSSTTGKNGKNSYNSEMYNYDNAEDYADDYAEDYAYDEFGGTESEEAYDYGYEEAYDAWEDEMDD